MNKNTDGCIGIRILSPLTGTAVPLEEVPDPVFSQKIIGDGVAILPRDGNLVSPIDGEVVSIAETLHAYGLRSEDGIEVMVHFGLETVALKGECFQCCVKIGDKVKAGSLLAKADLKALEEKQVNTIYACPYLRRNGRPFHECLHRSCKGRSRYRDNGFRPLPAGRSRRS